MEFLAKSAANEGPLVAFGGSDGVIRVLSMITWKVPSSKCFALLIWPLIFCPVVSENMKVPRIGVMWFLFPLQLARRYTGGHKGSIACLMTFMASSGEVVSLSLSTLSF